MMEKEPVSRGPTANNKSKSIQLLYANVRGVHSKLPCLKDVISDLKPSIVVLTETHLSNNNDIRIDGYSFFGRAREGNSGGGVGICVSQTLKNHAAPLHSQRDLEIIWVSLNRNSETPVFIGAYYGKQEGVSSDVIHDEYNKLTEEILEMKEMGEVILCLDANAKIGLMGETTSRNGKLLLDLVDECQLEIMNKSDICQGVVTRQNRKKLDETSAIDFILATYDASNWFTEMTIDELGEYRMRSKNESDHNTITASITINRLKAEHTDKSSDWNLNAPEEKWDQFRNELSNLLPTASEIMSDKESSMDDRYAKVEKLIYKAAIKTIGRTTYKGKGNAKASEKMRNLKKERAEYKKDFEKEVDQETKGIKLQRYYDKQDEIKELVLEEEQEKTEKRFQNMIEEANNGGFWGEMKRMNKDETSNWQITKDPSGRRIFDPELNKENVANYYEDLYGRKPTQHHPYHDTVENEVDRLSRQTPDSETTSELDRAPTVKEIEEAIRKKKDRKATTDWSNILIKRGGVAMAKLITIVIRSFWNEEIPPSQWNAGIITNVWKGKGDREMLQNQRGITVSSTIGTIAEEIINNRLLQTISFTQAQAGGKKGASPTDHVFILKNIMAIARKEGRELIVSYFDVQKAYDRACMKDMLYVLHENGFCGKIWRLTRALNVNLTARIKTKAGLTREIVREMGGKQGGKLMVPMFAKTMDTLAEEMMVDETLGIMINGEKIPVLIFMDDVLTFSEGYYQQQLTLDAVNEFGRKHQIKWGSSKCKVMEAGSHREKRQEWSLGEQTITNCNT